MLNNIDVMEHMEQRRQRRVVDEVAKIIGQDEAEALAADIYSTPDEVQPLTRHEKSLLNRMIERRQRSA